MEGVPCKLKRDAKIFGFGVRKMGYSIFGEKVLARFGIKTAPFLLLLDRVCRLSYWIRLSGQSKTDPNRNSNPNPNPKRHRRPYLIRLSGQSKTDPNHNSTYLPIYLSIYTNARRNVRIDRPIVSKHRRGANPSQRRNGHYSLSPLG